MLTLNLKRFWILGLSLLLLARGAYAQIQSEIRFTQTELDALVVLLKPEGNTLELDGQSGILTPAPSLRALGVEPLRFDLDFRGLSDLANIQFNHLKGGSALVRFEGASLLIEVPIQDQTRAVRSILGSLSVKNAKVRARLGWHVRPNGESELVVSSAEMIGKLSGTGLLKPGFMINLVKKLIARTLDQTLTRIIRREQVAEGVREGLLTWAKFSTGTEARSIVPRSVQFYHSSEGSGLRYVVE